jgi:imidazolonepropionase-like amidohydrolase
MMRFATIFRSLSILVLLASAVVPGRAQTLPEAFALTNVNVIDVTNGAVKPKQTVIITDGRIAKIGPASKTKIPKNVRAVEGAGKFLIPGLWDMHVHLDGLGEAGLGLFVANGVTSVREMGGGDFAELKALRDRVESGSVAGPRLKVSGPIIESTRFLQLLERLLKKSLVGKRIGVATEDEAAKAVRSIKDLGADFLKIRTNASRETYLAIAAEAKQSGLMLVGHSPIGLSLVEMSDAGQKSVEHGPVFLGNFSDPEWHEIGARFVKNGTFSVPTLVAERGFRHMPDKDVLAIISDNDNKIDPRRKYVPPAMLEFWRESMEMKKFESPTNWEQVKARNLHGFRLLKQAGVRMMAGTDVGSVLVFPGFSLHEELESMVKEIGMTPLEALQSATRNPAEFFGMSESLGSLEEGKIADLVLLDANPLQDIRNTRAIDSVILRGRLYSRADLNRLLAAAETAAVKKME